MKIIVLRLMLTVISVFGLSSCLTTSGVPEQVTSFNVAGCNEKDVKIFDESVDLNGERNWTAECEGKIYQCTYFDSVDTACYEITE